MPCRTETSHDLMRLALRHSAHDKIQEWRGLDVQKTAPHIATSRKTCRRDVVVEGVTTDLSLKREGKAWANREGDSHGKARSRFRGRARAGKVRVSPLLFVVVKTLQSSSRTWLPLQPLTLLLLLFLPRIPYRQQRQAQAAIPLLCSSERGPDGRIAARTHGRKLACRGPSPCKPCAAAQW